MSQRIPRENRTYSEECKSSTIATYIMVCLSLETCCFLNKQVLMLQFSEHTQPDVHLLQVMEINLAYQLKTHIRQQAGEVKVQIEGFMKLH